MGGGDVDKLWQNGVNSNGLYESDVERNLRLQYSRYFKIFKGKEIGNISVVKLYLKNRAPKYDVYLVIARAISAAGFTVQVLA